MYEELALLNILKSYVLHQILRGLSVGLDEYLLTDYFSLQCLWAQYVTALRALSHKYLVVQGVSIETVRFKSDAINIKISYIIMASCDYNH